MSNEVAARIWAEIGGRPLIVLVPDLDDRSLSVAAQQRLAFPALKNVEDEDDDEGEYDLEASRRPYRVAGFPGAGRSWPRSMLNLCKSNWVTASSVAKTFTPVFATDSKLCARLFRLFNRYSR